MEKPDSQMDTMFFCPHEENLSGKNRWSVHAGYHLQTRDGILLSTMNALCEKFPQSQTLTGMKKHVNFMFHVPYAGLPQILQMVTAIMGSICYLCSKRDGFTVHRVLKLRFCIVCFISFLSSSWIVVKGIVKCRSQPETDDIKSIFAIDSTDYCILLSSELPLMEKENCYLR